MSWILVSIWTLISCIITESVKSVVFFASPRVVQRARMSQSSLSCLRLPNVTSTLTSENGTYTRTHSKLRNVIAIAHIICISAADWTSKLVENSVSFSLVFEKCMQASLKHRHLLNHDATLADRDQTGRLGMMMRMTISIIHYSAHHDERTKHPPHTCIYVPF